MKQSILFEKGKLYVAELPEEPRRPLYKFISENECPDYYVDMIKFEHDKKEAIANKVEVKNPELIVKGGTHGILFTLENKQLLDGDTFDLPDGIEVEIKHEWPNPCIPHKYCLENYELKKESCKTNCVRQKLVSTAILKRIEPEKPEEYKHIVESFGAAMIKELNDNQHKTPWTTMSSEEIFEELEYHVDKLRKSFSLEHCANVANLSMMLWDTIQRKKS